MRIILASKSPRRKMFMDMLGLEYDVMPSRVDESETKAQENNPVELARKLARLKAEDVAARLKGDSRSQGPDKNLEQDGGEEGAIVIGADTLVSFQGRVIGKARDEEDAFKTLKGYMGKEHEQITGLCIINTRTGKVLEGHDVTKAVVREMSDEEIREYVRTGEPLEGAGCYTPKAHPMMFERIEGSWSNVVGLPMERFVPLLGKALRE